MAWSVDHVLRYPTEDTQVWFSPNNWGLNVWFLCKIAFLHVNLTHHWAMGDMVFQREERPYLLNAVYVILVSLPIPDDQGQSSTEGTSTVYRLKFMYLSSFDSPPSSITHNRTHTLIYHQIYILRLHVLVSNKLYRIWFFLPKSEYTYVLYM